jgi:AcrR family transcriptional regulator
MGIAERREREKEQRHNDIIDAAERVFFSKGMENATMDDVAEEAELSKGTLYLYFKSKEEIYLAIHLRGNKILKNMFNIAVANQERGIDKVHAVGEAYFEYYRTYPDYFNAMIYYESRTIEFQAENSIAVECMMEGKATLDILVNAINTGIYDGSIRPDVDPIKTAISLWGQSTGIIQIIALKENIILNNYSLKANEIVEYTFNLISHSLSV